MNFNPKIFFEDSVPFHLSGMAKKGGSRYIEPLQSRGKQGTPDEGSEPGLRNSDCPHGNLAAKAFLKR